jgi:S-ribosylhomocysteine lyase LuxS involved in autoinducer biosynthesis
MLITTEVATDINDIHTWAEATKEKVTELIDLLPESELKRCLEYTNDSLADAVHNMNKAMALVNKQD